MSVIDESGQPLVWTAVYWRYFQRRTEECESLEDAVAFLAFGLDAGSLAFESILGPEGDPVFANDAELQSAISAYSNNTYEQWARRTRPELLSGKPPGL